MYVNIYLYTCVYLCAVKLSIQLHSKGITGGILQIRKLYELQQTYQISLYLSRLTDIMAANTMLWTQ